MTSSSFLTDVLEVCLEWGPELGSPIPPRVRRKHPTATDEEIEAAIRTAEALQRRASELTEPGWPLDDVTDEERRRIGLDAAATLHEEFPAVATSAIDHAISQANYYHWHG